MQHFLDNEKEIKKIVSSKKNKIIFLDFDGTLVSIAPTPEAVCLSLETEKVLRKLSRRRDILLVIVSGRPLQELGSYLNLKNIVLAGNHGLEIKGRGFTLPLRARQARKLRHFIVSMAQKFKIAFHYLPGVWVEDKKYTLSIHFRKLAIEQESIFRSLIRFFKQKYGHYPVVWTHGKKVVEIRPSVYWGKGDTVMHVLKKNPKALLLAFGDDRTDEDMFRILKKKGGTAVHVGRLRSTVADYYLESHEEVRKFLERLC